MNASNPTLIASDLTTTENQQRQYSVMLGLGWSKSSLMGDESYSANVLIWSTLNQFAFSGGYTKMDFSGGKLNAIHSYGVTTAYLQGNLMAMGSYTYIKPHPKYGTYGYNVGLINLFLQNEKKTGYNHGLVSSAVVFWTKPFQYSKKLSYSPGVFIMSSPLAYNPMAGTSAVNRHVGFLVGSSIDYKLSKRFGMSFNYRLNINTQPGTTFTNNFLIGSRMVL